MKSLVSQLINNYKKKTTASGSEGGQVQLDETEQIQQAALTYQECYIEGEHSGELLNLVCVDPECKKMDPKQQSLLCCICYEKNHKGHKVKPLKAFVREFSHHVQQSKFGEKVQNKLDKDLLLSEFSNQKLKIKESLAKTRLDVIQAFDALEQEIGKLFINLEQQVEDMTVTETDLEAILESVYQNQKDIEKLGQSIKVLIENLPNEKLQTDKQVEQSQVLAQIQTIAVDNFSQISNLNQVLKKTIDDVASQFEQKGKISLFQAQLSFSFSTTYKHPSVTIVSPSLVKANTPTSGYKFALMNPSLETSLGRKVKFGFKLNEVNASNWLAIGMCHMKTIVNKGYTFSFSTLGHGAYMISSNGGSWSTIKAQFNNVVKTFKFQKNDTIHCLYNPAVKTLTFQKNKTIESYVLDFEIQPNDPLHICALFYYNNDEVEFLQPEQCPDM